MDVRVGGGYRLAFGHDRSASRVFFGRYLEVTPPSRLVWTNDEGEEITVTTVTFEDQDGTTRLVLNELHPSKETLDEALIGMEDGMPKQYEQLDALLLTLGEGAKS